MPLPPAHIALLYDDLLLDEDVFREMQSTDSTPALTPMPTPANGVNFLQGDGLDLESSILGPSALPALTNMSTMNMNMNSMGTTRNHQNKGDNGNENQAIGINDTNSSGSNTLFEMLGLPKDQQLYVMNRPGSILNERASICNVERDTSTQFKFPSIMFGPVPAASISLNPSTEIRVDHTKIQAPVDKGKSSSISRCSSLSAVPIQPNKPMQNSQNMSHSKHNTPQLAPTPHTTPIMPSPMFNTPKISPMMPPLQLTDVKSNYQAIMEGEGSTRGFSDDVLKMVGNRKIHHKTSEKRRRETINQLFARAAELVPILNQQRLKGVNHSKTVILQHVVEYIGDLPDKEECNKRLRLEKDALVRENKKLKSRLGEWQQE
eukprot:CFRG0859T1